MSQGTSVGTSWADSSAQFAVVCSVQMQLSMHSVGHYASAASVLAVSTIIQHGIVRSSMHGSSYRRSLPDSAERGKRHGLCGSMS